MPRIKQSSAPVAKKAAAPIATKSVTKVAAKKAKPVAKVAAKKEKPSMARAGHGSVRTTILTLLAAGSKTRKELLDQGKFSPASLFNVLKVLKKEGTIAVSADNRVVSATGQAAPAKAEKGVAANKIVVKAAKPMVEKAAAKKSSPKVRAAHGSVRETILSLLTAGSLTRKEILKQGGFSPASMFNVLKTLKTQGAIKISADNRTVSIASARAAKHPSPEIIEVEVSSTALIPVAEHAMNALHSALESIQRIFMAPERMHEKLATLDRLVETLPTPIADVLASIREDYARMSPTKAPY